LAEAANKVSRIDILEISPENIQRYLNSIPKVEGIDISSIPQTRQDRINISRLLAQANPRMVIFGSVEIYMQISNRFKYHIRNYTRIYLICFKTVTGTVNIITDLWRTEIPQLLNRINIRLNRITLAFALTSNPVFTEMQHAVRKSWAAESNTYSVCFTRVV
jgi:hypothetical protein